MVKHYEKSRLRQQLKSGWSIYFLSYFPPMEIQVKSGIHRDCSYPFHVLQIHTSPFVLMYG
jgi:hypothetical protein